MNEVILLSGGVDSAVLLASRLARGHSCSAITFKYGQIHSKEVEAAEVMARHYKVNWRVIPLVRIKGSALTGDGEIPVGHADEPDATYVPGRNLLMIAAGVSHAEQVGASAVLIGANMDDAAGYPDCRPNFIKAISLAAELGTASGVTVSAPFIDWPKAAIIKHGFDLGVPMYKTWSCYRGGSEPCGTCGACVSRVHLDAMGR